MSETSDTHETKKYETRAALLVRVRRQRETILALQAELADARRTIHAARSWRDEVARLQGQLRAVTVAGSAAAEMSGDALAELCAVLRTFRAAIRDDRTGEIVGGRMRRIVLADVDAAAVRILERLGRIVG